jgi:hypothetical protein
MNGTRPSVVYILLGRLAAVRLPVTVARKEKELDPRFGI